MRPWRLEPGDFATPSHLKLGAARIMKIKIDALASGSWLKMILLYPRPPICFGEVEVTRVA